MRSWGEDVAARVSRPQLHGKKTRQPADLISQRCTERTLICRLVALADCTERTRGVSSMSWALDHSLKFTRYVLRFRRPLATTATIASSSYPLHTGPTYWDYASVGSRLSYDKQGRWRPSDACDQSATPQTHSALSTRIVPEDTAITSALDPGLTEEYFYPHLRATT